VITETTRKRKVIQCFSRWTAKACWFSNTNSKAFLTRSGVMASVSGRMKIACWSDIDPLHEVLIEVAPVPADRWGAYREGIDRARRRDIFKPSGPRLTDYELILMDDMVNRLEEGEVTSRRADAIAAAVNLLRLTLRSENGETHPHRELRWRSEPCAGPRSSIRRFSSVCSNAQILFSIPVPRVSRADDNEDHDRACRKRFERRAF
jgi:hypothetical protein